MPPPLPLTAAPTARLDWSRGAVPVAKGFDDIYFSVDGGLEETRFVFLQGCSLPQRWANGQDHHIGELGFGSGLNFLTVWHDFEACAKPEQKLDFTSIEKFPFTRNMLQKALSHWPQFGDKAARLTALWPGPVKGVHRLHLTENVTLTLYIDDIQPALSDMSAPIDSWFLDGFSPSKNPDMWSAGVMKRLAELSHNQTHLATFTAAGDVRRALGDAGFNVQKKDGFGRKRHRLIATYIGGPKPPTRPDIAPLIIGGGIAGASLCRAAKQFGLTAKLIHNDPAMDRAASGNPAALIKPRLDLQDREESRFFLASYLYALRAYEHSHEHHEQADIILSRGITQIAKDPAELARFEKLTAQAPLPLTHLAAHPKGLYFPSALTINPRPLISLWTTATPSRTANITHMAKTGDNWTAHDKDGQIIAASKTMIIASGAGVRDIHLPSGESIAAALSLRFSRGQLTWAKEAGKTPLNQAIAYGGYAIPLGQDILLGATHNRLDARDDYALRPEDDAHNLGQARHYLETELTAAPQKSRASLRVTTVNSLPQVIEIKPGLWVMTGLGSRGFVFAPLLANNLTAYLCRKAPSLTPRLWAKLSHN